MAEIDVLIVGAGPTGLALALWLTQMGVRVRIVDKSPEPARTSKAVAVQARTLELYRQIGLAEELVTRGVPCTAVSFWARSERKARVEFGAHDKTVTPFPYVLMYPQDEHEKTLLARLERAGVHVDRPTELVSFDDVGRVTARLRRSDGSIEVCNAEYVAGCDGARSAVRHASKIDFSGGTYSRLFYVADVDASGPTMNGEIDVALDEGDFLASFPIVAKSRVRLVGAVRDDTAEREASTLRFEDVRSRIVDRLGLKVEHVNGFSTYRVHHRVASAFRAGRAFLLGDAARIHSPVGGQGMNTGIGDAVNLAWKLAAVVHGHAPDALLDSYAEERMPFARRLVKTTDRAFELVTAEGAIADRVRLDVAPRLFAALTRSSFVRRILFETVSQTTIAYRRGRLSEGRAGRVHGGDRLPWVAYEGHDNFDPLTSLDWQVHVYGEAERGLAATCDARSVPLHAFPWDAGAESAGLERDAVYLVRPDGYVALAAAPAEAAKRVEAYLGTQKIRRPKSPASALG